MIFESLDAEMQVAVKTRHDAIRQAPRLDFLKPRHASDMGPFKVTYVVYAQFSGDAAHPTITALGRHWTLETDGIYLDVQPAAKEEELDETLHFACIALLSAMVVVNEMVGFTEAGKALPALNHELREMQGRRWGSDSVNEGMEIRTGEPSAEST